MLTKRATIARLLACAVIVSAMPLGARAQEQDPKPIAKPVTEVAAEPATEQAAEPVTFGSLMIALKDVGAQIDELQALSNLTAEGVQVVNVEGLLQGASLEVLNNTVDEREAEIRTLKDALSGNEVIMSALSDNNVAIEDVVAVDVLRQGEVVVFYQPHP